MVRGTDKYYLECAKICLSSKKSFSVGGDPPSHTKVTDGENSVFGKRHKLPCLVAGVSHLHQLAKPWPKSTVISRKIQQNTIQYTICRALGLDTRCKSEVLDDPGQCYFVLP